MGKHSICKKYMKQDYMDLFLLNSVMFVYE